MNIQFYCLLDINEKIIPFINKKSSVLYSPVFNSSNEATKFALSKGFDCDEFIVQQIRLAKD